MSTHFDKFLCKPRKKAVVFPTESRKYNSHPSVPLPRQFPSDLLQCPIQRIHLGKSVIDAKADTNRAVGRGLQRTVSQGGAMISASNTDAPLVQPRPHQIRAATDQIEQQNCPLLLRRVQLHLRQTRQRLFRVAVQGALMCRN